MAKNCCVCGRKIGIISMGYALDEIHDFVLCERCDSQYSRLNKSKYDSETVKSALGYMESYFAKNDIDQFAKEIILKRMESTKNSIAKEMKNEENAKKLEMNQFITSGYNFEGYRIIKYCGIVSGEVVIGTGFLSEFGAGISDLFGSASDSFANKMLEVKKAAQIKLIQNAVDSGGNAVIGVDFDYITFDKNMIGVSANGTAVLIEKIQRV